MKIQLSTLLQLGINSDLEIRREYYIGGRAVVSWHNDTKIHEYFFNTLYSGYFVRDQELDIDENTSIGTVEVILKPELKTKRVTFVMEIYRRMTISELVEHDKQTQLPISN